jgi:hypothetical protein
MRERCVRDGVAAEGSYARQLPNSPGSAASRRDADADRRTNLKSSNIGERWAGRRPWPTQSLRRVEAGASGMRAGVERSRQS